MGALSVPPLVQVPLDVVCPDRVEEKKRGNNYSQTPTNCPQSIAVSGTTPSGCTQRAPTGPDFTDQVEELKRDIFIKTPAEGVLD